MTPGRGNMYRNNLVAGSAIHAFQLRNGLTHSRTIGSEPLFADSVRSAGFAAYALSASSSTIGRGLATDAPADDIEGDPRGASIDIGANEY